MTKISANFPPSATQGSICFSPSSQHQSQRCHVPRGRLKRHVDIVPARTVWIPRAHGLVLPDKVLGRDGHYGLVSIHYHRIYQSNSLHANNYALIAAHAVDLVSEALFRRDLCSTRQPEVCRPSNKFSEEKKKHPQTQAMHESCQMFPFVSAVCQSSVSCIRQGPQCSGIVYMFCCS